MRFLRELAQTRAASNEPITGARLAELFAGGAQTSSGASVTPESALRIGAALRSTQIISASVAGLPLKVFREGSTEPVPEHPLMRTGALTEFDMWEMVTAHLVLWGNAYIYSLRDRNGRVRSLVPVHPSRVTVEVADTGLIDIPHAKRFTVDGKLVLTEYELTQIMGMSLDGVRGVSPVTYARETFGIALSAEQAAGKMYSNGMMLSGILTTEQPLNQPQSDALKERWKAKLGGVDNAHDVAILDRGAQFQPLSMPPADAQFLESRKFEVTEIARLFGLPGWMLNDQEKSTSWGTGMEQQFTMFVMMTLKSYLQRIEQRCTRNFLPTGQRAEFKVEGLLRGDSAARAQFYASGIQHGWMVPNEPRALENMPPVEWGDKPYRPYNASSNSDSAPNDEDGSDESNGA